MFERTQAVEHADASPRTVDGVLATMIDHGWLMTGYGNSRGYAGTTALLGAPDGDVPPVLSTDKTQAVTLSGVAERLETDKSTAYAALRETPTAVTYTGITGWYPSDG